MSDSTAPEALVSRGAGLDLTCKLPSGFLCLLWLKEEAGGL